MFCAESLTPADRGLDDGMAESCLRCRREATSAEAALRALVAKAHAAGHDSPELRAASFAAVDFAMLVCRRD